MKKVILVATTALLSTTALADGFSGHVGLGYQTTGLDNHAWGDTAATAGLALETKFNFGPGLFATIDLAFTEDEQNDGDDTYSDQTNIDWTDNTIGFGYALSLNDASAITFALEFSDIEAVYKSEYTDISPWFENDEITIEDSGASLVLGGTVAVNDKLSAGASVSLGFAQGIEAYTQYALTESFSIKAAYSTKSYELGDYSGEWSNAAPASGSYTFNGIPDYEVDAETFRVSGAFTF